jgi:galactosamine-6-phosphate isomerase
MNIKYCTDYKQMSQFAADTVVEVLKTGPGKSLCAATGNSPKGTYKYLATIYKKNPGFFKDLRIIKLDEWGGLPNSDPNSCDFYVRQKLLRPLHISSQNYISFDGNADLPQGECERIEQQIKDLGSIDIAILGLGVNGHIGFNEPADILQPQCHIAKLSPESLNHQMISKMSTKSDYGLTLGMENILQAKKIILLVTGVSKENVTEQLLKKVITPQLPASYLWQHDNVDCLIALT